VIDPCTPNAPEEYREPFAIADDNPGAGQRAEQGGWFRAPPAQRVVLHRPGCAISNSNWPGEINAIPVRVPTHSARAAAIISEHVMPSRGHARTIRSLKLQSKSGRPAPGSSRPSLRTPASGGVRRNLHPDETTFVLSGDRLRCSGLVFGAVAEFGDRLRVLRSWAGVSGNPVLAGTLAAGAEPGSCPRLGAASAQ
jgi:hypothetical protein